jgi:KDO2-lipid IV(A) lauroyltransferase
LIRVLIDTAIKMIGGAAHLLHRLLGLRGTAKLGKWLGSLLCALKPRKRHVAIEEVSRYLGKQYDEPEIQGIVKRSFQVYYARHLESLFFGDLTKERISRVASVEGLENLDKALASDKGVILLLAHFGSFLLPLPLLGHLGYKVNQVTGRPVHYSFFGERLWRWRKRQADRLPVNFIQVGGFLRPLYKALQRNEIVTIAFDGRDSTKFMSVPFLDGSALFSPAPINLALKTGARIVPTFVIRHPDETHTVILEKPIEVTGSGPRDSVVRRHVEGFAALFADFVKRFPCHYGMILVRMRMDAERGMANPLSDDDICKSQRQDAEVTSK